MRKISVLIFCLFVSSSILAQEIPLFTTDFPPEEFAERRARVYEAMGKNGIALIQGAPMPHGYVKFRQYNEFYYLCGVESPYSYLLLNGSTQTATVYLPARNERRERVEGKLFSAEDDQLVRKLTGIDSVSAVGMLSEHLAQLTASNPEIEVYTPLSPPEGYATSRGLAIRRIKDIKADPWDGRISREQNFIKLVKKTVNKEVKDLSPILDQMRLIKSDRELKLIRKATRLSGLALMEAMRSTIPGVWEYELDAVAKFIFFRGGAQGHAYYSLVAGGKNSWYPHYHASKKQLVDGELILMDSGPNVGYYTTDVTRQWPVNGKFEQWQRELYGFYLGCYKAILDEIKPFNTGKEIKQRAAITMEKVLAEATFSKPEYTKAATSFVENYKKSIQSGRYRLGHWVGMAVHDVGQYSGKYLPGMVFTIEPALRVPEEKIYIRLEDMILITKDGIEILSEFVPMDMEEIESLMQEPGILQNYPEVKTLSSGMIPK